MPTCATCAASAALWAGERSLPEYVESFARSVPRASGGAAFARSACGSTARWSARASATSASCAAASARCASRHRRRVHPPASGARLCQRADRALLDAERAAGTDLAFLFSDIHRNSTPGSASSRCPAQHRARRPAAGRASRSGARRARPFGHRPLLRSTRGTPAVRLDPAAADVGLAAIARALARGQRNARRAGSDARPRTFRLRARPPVSGRRYVRARRVRLQRRCRRRIDRGADPQRRGRSAQDRGLAAAQPGPFVAAARRDSSAHQRRGRGCAAARRPGAAWRQQSRGLERGCRSAWSADHV